MNQPSQFAGHYGQPLGARSLVAGQGHDVAGRNESRWPNVLGVLTAVYLAAVSTMSAAGASVAWIPQVIGISLGVGWLVIGVLFQGRRLIWCAPVNFYILFVLWCVTGLVVTIDRNYFLTLYLTLVKVTVVTWVALQCVRSRQDLLICCLFVCIAGVVVLVAGLDKVLHAVESTGQGIRQSDRASETLVNNANGLGIFGVLVLVSAVAIAMGYRSAFFRMLSLGFGTCGLYIVAASGSRSAMVGVGIGALALYYYHFRKAGAGSIGKKIVVSFLGLLLLGGTAYYISSLPFFYRMKEVVSSAQGVQSEPRYIYFVRALGATAAHPVLGLGLGGFAMHGLGRTVSGMGHYSHSTVSETLSCTGVAGFAIYYGGQLLLLRLIYRVRRLPLGSRNFAIVNVVMALFWSQLVISVVGVIYDDRLIWPLLGATCGFLRQLQHDYGHAVRDQFSEVSAMGGLMAG